MNADRRIWTDYETVCQNIAELLRTPNQNFTVIQPHYIRPSVMNTVVPMQDPNGEYQYFLNIRPALEAVLAFGKIPRGMLPHKAPTYLSDLAHD